MPIDAHIHLNLAQADVLGVLAEFNLKVLNVCVACDHESPSGWQTHHRAPYVAQARHHPSRFAWVTSFDPPATHVGPNYADRVIAGLEVDFGAGAVGCKLWKNVGMDCRTAEGDYRLPDDPVFDPIYAWLARHDRTLLAHVAEPLACWQPLTPGTPHYRYYSQSPEWHMHGRTDVPSHATLMHARDRVLERHPRLRFVGAHFGSMEYSLAEIAARFERFPNFAVDTSARLADAATHDPQHLREFLTRYAGRVLWGTDLMFCDDPARHTPRPAQQVTDYVRRTYAAEFAFYAGLDLPGPAREQLFHAAARTWYPGL